jgi:alcohol dehydrogenase (cytochrome c)
MNKKTRIFLLCFLCASAARTLITFAAAQELPSVLKNYKRVTAQRLLKPEDNNWLMIRRTYDGWGYSPLDKIDAKNVSRLKQVWTIETGEARVHESAPIVNNGVMFVTTRTTR